MRTWLEVDEDHESCVTVTVQGGCAFNRADDLWDAAENALQIAVGRVVILDLWAVTTFDIGCIQSLHQIMADTSRRHLDLYLVLRPGSALAQYATWSGATTPFPVFPTHSAALLATAF
ncbi:STAS domain-containing protein [Pseudonocardia spinosispora]|uniref:STAS domain-containing protein n=1 Tax=Pseudonocardia spinosispora TaxID=103441 RepID=UPI0012EC91CE|nr:STAS domain-containing protein [Pseudonocardia spinosispora]